MTRNEVARVADEQHAREARRAREIRLRALTPEVRGPLNMRALLDIAMVEPMNEIGRRFFVFG